MRTYNVGDKIDADHVNDDAEILLDCAEIGYSHTAIRTTHKDIMNMLSQSVDECKLIIGRVRNALKNKDVPKMYREQSEEWKNFCDDVAIYYVCRFKVFGKMIPVCIEPKYDDLD